MKKRNINFARSSRRDSFFNWAILPLFFNLSSLPRLILEVFIRKDFGERYFSVPAVLTTAVILFLFPGTDFWSLMDGRYRRQGYGEEGIDWQFWYRYATWFLFVIAFLYFSFLRWTEVRRNPSVFDFKRYTKSAGQVHPLFFNLRLFGNKAGIRTVEILLEPSLFFILGLLLRWTGQELGNLLIFASVIYSLSYVAAYKMGDEEVMDKIDQMIINEEMEDAFVNELDSEQTRGFRTYCRKPTSEDLRRKVSEAFIEILEEDETVAR